MYLNILPNKVVVPGTLQVAHIGMENGLHEAKNQKVIMAKRYGDLKEFHLKLTKDTLIPSKALGKTPKKGFGGWGHPADQEHCMKLFGGTAGAGEGGQKQWSLFK